MRATNLAKVAAQAEILRLQHMLKRQVLRAAYGLVALIFAIGVLVFVNIAAWQTIRLYLSPIYSTLIMLSVNLVLAALFGLLAARSSPGHTEHEALAIRQQALEDARNSLAMGALIPMAGALLRSRRTNSRRLPFWRRLR